MKRFDSRNTVSEDTLNVKKKSSFIQLPHLKKQKFPDAKIIEILKIGFVLTEDKR